MPMLKKMRDNRNSVFISSEIQKQKLSLVPAKCHQSVNRIHKRTCRQVYTRSSSVAGYSVIAVYILSNAKLHLSYDVVVIRWKTSCHKNRMNTRVINNLACIRIVIDNVRVNNASSY